MKIRHFREPLVRFLFCFRVAVELDPSVFEDKAAGVLRLAFEFGDRLRSVEGGKRKKLAVNVDLGEVDERWKDEGWKMKGERR